MDVHMNPLLYQQKEMISNMSKKKVVGIGEIVWDMFPDGSVLGGAPLNFAFVAGELGCQPVIISAVGSDELAEQTLARIAEIGLDTSTVQRNELPTGRVLVTLDDKGIPQYEILENVSWDQIACSAAEKVLVADADAVCWGSLAQRSQVSGTSIPELLDAVRPECLKVFDINIRQHYYSREVFENSLMRTDVLKLNEDELPLVSEIFGIEGSDAEKIHALIERFNLKMIIYTAGAAFSEIYDKTGCLSHVDTPKVNVVDTVGAGDSFTAGFIASYLNGSTVRDAHERAVRISAYMCTQKGAINHVSNVI